MDERQERRLYVAWRRPAGLIVPVGCLTQSISASGPEFRFVYLKGASLEDDFPPLPGFADLDREYCSPCLFPVFSNRVMPRERPDYDTFVEQLDLSVEADPFEVLGRSEGVRVTDRIEVFPEPERAVDGSLTTVFFARGLRHLDGASEAAEALRVGDVLELQPDLANLVNPRALLLNTRTGTSIGWAPDYLLDLLEELDQLNGCPAAITVEHVNPPSVAPHLRVLCRATAPWPDHYRPFSGAQFQPLVRAS